MYMKTFFLLSLALFFTHLLPAQIGSELYSSKSGKISYRYEYSGIVSNFSIVFDNYGKKQYFDLLGTEGDIADHSRTIITPEAMYVINYEEKQIMKFPLTQGTASVDEYGGSSAGGIDLPSIAKAIKQSGQSKKGVENVLGKSCDVFEFAEPEGSKGKYWIWKGFILKADFLDENGDHSFIEAKEIGIDIAIDSKEFEIPSGYEITDMSKSMEQMKQLQEKYGVPEDSE
jgi:hypothetical protein